MQCVASDEYIPNPKILHWEIGENHSHFERSVKIAQSRFVTPPLGCPGTLIQFMLEEQIKAGYVEVMPNTDQ